MGDPYEILGLATDATDADITAARRRLAKQHHPDASAEADREEAAARMVAINWAADELLDPVKRASHDLDRARKAARDVGSDDESGSDGVRFSRADVPSEQGPPVAERRPREWRTAPPPIDLTIREFDGWGDAHWLYVHAPDGRVATMDVTTGAVTIEREELREQVLLALQHHAFNRW